MQINDVPFVDVNSELLMPTVAGSVEESLKVLDDLVKGVESRWINRKSTPPKELVEPYKRAKQFLGNN